MSDTKFNAFSVSKYLLLLYIAVLPIQSGSKVQLSEYVFLLLFSTVLIGSIINFQNLKTFNFQKTDIGVLILIVGYLPSFFYQIFNHGVGKSITSIVELGGIIYLAALYFSIRTLAFLTSKNEVHNFIKNGLLLSGIIAALTIIAGTLSSYFFQKHSFVQHYNNFPYLGDVVRATGLMISPNMIMSLLVTAFIFNYEKIKHNYPLTGLFLFSMVLTLSKSWLILLSVFCFFIPIKNFYFKGISRIAAFGFCFTYLLLVHVFVDTKFNLSKDVDKEDYIGNQPIIEFENIKIFPTTYASLKKAAVVMGNENFLFGVGPGNFNSGLQNLKLQGIYGKNLPNYDPHSSLTGTYAELGILGWIGFVIFMFILFSTIKKHSPKQWTINAIFLFFLIETISTDTLNFRHYWIGFALLSIMISMQTLPPSSYKK